MLDLGWSEILVIGAIAVVVVGPKEMPKVIRGISNILSKIRNMTSEFSRTMNDIADQEDYVEIMDELKRNNADLEKNIEEANRRLAQNNAFDDEVKPKKKAKSKKAKSKKSKTKKSKK
ncbi:MAG: Sec-independent protein translocase protein TatB [Alphaproteobacteria bacterium]